MSIGLFETIDLVERCVTELGWNKTKSVELVEQYIWFFLKKIELEDWNCESLSPSPMVDQVWHLHILDTRAYAKACGKNFVNHDPRGAYSVNTEARNKRYTQTYMQLQFDDDNISEIVWPKPVEKKKRERSKQKTKVLVVKDLRGKSIFVKIPSESATGADIKLELRKQTKTSVQMMRIIYAGEVIEDDESVDFLQEHSTLNLVMMLGGC